MNPKEKLAILTGLPLTLPQRQGPLDTWLQNPLLLPLVGITLVALVALAALAFLLRAWIAVQVRALLPRNRLEARYLEAVQQTFGKTPALLAGSDGAAYSDLALIEAFSPLTLRPDRDDGLDGAEGGLVERTEALPAARMPDGRAADRRGVGSQMVYWGLWAVAQALLLAHVVNYSCQVAAFTV